MIDKSRIKEVLTTYLENMNNIIEKRTASGKYIFEQARDKNFIIPYKTPLWNKSKNLQSFLSHRRMLDSRVRNQFNLDNKIPYVLRFHHLNKKNKEHFKEMDEVMRFHNTITMGCHNIADRISVKNPKTIKSVRTFFSFPHYGKQKEMKEELNGDMYYNEKRVIDKNGFTWISHSINAIKNGNEFYKHFGDDIIDDLPITENKEYNETTFNQIGNDVLFDMDILDYPLMGIYGSFNYLKRDEFDFEEFNEEELYEVERWLDYEWMSLVTQSANCYPKSGLYSDVNEENINKVYMDCIKELIDERGYRFIFPIVLTSWREGVHQAQRNMMSNRKGTEAVSKYLRNSTEEEAKMGYEKWLKEMGERFELASDAQQVVKEGLRIDENGWFFPLPEKFSTPAEYRNHYYSSWIEKSGDDIKKGYSKF